MERENEKSMRKRDLNWNRISERRLMGKVLEHKTLMFRGES